MPSKRSRDEDAAVDAGASSTADDSRKPKKAKHGFRVGPENLPDGAWRRKVTKIKKDLITKAKVKKQYAKIKAEHQKQASAPTPEDHTQAEDTPEPTAHPEQGEDGAELAPAQIHPERQAMLDAPSSLSNPPPQRQQRQPRQQHQQQSTTHETDPAQPPPHDNNHPRQKRKHHHHHKPDYYTKELAAAERAKQAAAERAAEAARREQERQQRITERERYRKAMAKAKTPGRDGRVKIGRESRLLLERVQRVVGKS